MIAIVDVYYHEDRAVVGVVLVESLLQDEPSRELSIEHLSSTGKNAPYWAEQVRRMAGPYRLPTLIKRADLKSRT